MRKEADDIGPSAELDHWKERMANFSSLLDEIKTNKVKNSNEIIDFDWTIFVAGSICDWCFTSCKVEGLKDVESFGFKDYRCCK